MIIVCKPVLSTINGLFAASNKSSLVFRHTVSLHVEESRSPDLSIIVVTHCGTNVIADEQILLSVSASEQVEHAGVCTITYCLQDHVVALLNSNESDIFHGLHEGECTSVCLLGLLMQVLVV